MGSTLTIEYWELWFLLMAHCVWEARGIPVRVRSCAATVMFQLIINWKPVRLPDRSWSFSCNICHWTILRAKGYDNLYNCIDDIYHRVRYQEPFSAYIGEGLFL